MDCLIIFTESVHNWDWQTAGVHLLVALSKELFVDIVECDQLERPWLGAGAQVRASHHHGLDQGSGYARLLYCVLCKAV